jgi:hypothetical protein
MLDEEHDHPQQRRMIEEKIAEVKKTIQDDLLA